MASAMSDTSKLYILSSKGKVFALKNGNHLERLESAIEIKRIAFANQSRDVVYGIGSDLKVCVWVAEPEVPVRQVVELYQNERWTPTRGYSDLLLPTDRHHWSDESGRYHRPREEVEVPSAHWQWDSANWEIDENFDGQLLGPDGWTYAIDFPATYSPDKRWNSMVRRRRWIRTCRYRSTNRFADLPCRDQSEADLAFIDIAAGGCDLSYPDGLTHVSVWAVSVLGQVYIRPVCSRTTAYHGMLWMRVDLPEGMEVSQIACGSSEGVWAVTATGWALVRTGISRDCQYGSGWSTVEPPFDALLLQVTVGPDSVWALGKDGSVWFRQNIKKSCPAGTGWVAISSFLATCLTVSRNGEVFALGSADRQLYWRSGVSLEDPHGRAWKKLSLVDKSGEGDNRDLWIWISATAGFLDSRSASWEGSEEWKDEVITQLSSRFSKEMQGFSTLNRAISRTGWKNSAVLKVWSGKQAAWEDCKVEVGCDEDDEQATLLTADGEKVHISMLISEVTAVQLHEDPQGSQELWIYTAFLTRAASPLRMSGSRNDIETWYTFLTECYWSDLDVKDLPKTDRVWILAPLTGCPSLSHGLTADALPSSKWLTLAGHFQTIESASGITWALGHDNSVWVWVGCYEGKSGTERRVQTDTRTVELYENQRWNPVGGFSSSLLPSDRYAWSDDAGRVSLTKDSFQLPSGSWRWESDWVPDYNQADDDGWRYSFDFPGAYHGQKLATDCVRRRRWYRTMKVESAAPWLPGPATKLKGISICPGVATGEIVPLWGVNSGRKRGVAGPSNDSESASDGTAYVRNGTKGKMDGLYWFQVEKPNNGAFLAHVTVGSSVVWALSQDNILYFRQNFSAAFPEGTDWIEVAGDITQISANHRDELYAISSGPQQSLPVLARRTGQRYDDKIGSGWEFGIFAKNVSARGLQV
ncbi:Tectonin beta-propeller repeat-containing protein 1 [Hypsibius exemplaris]|uniref:Tectonin beta-propeller repeat-containing protein 1 n=1 Tax=Hypsibius exemplaris TaxID=2072580 RepID=A0A9X6NJV7_HYPEX|nr:Tectonin beta-propeller repeat-containing protein 1 [Hypsibius exemplaris]